ncbi:hypothetical protein Salat_0148300 [Sesamum alatum]|uniref:Uncharacterized protein n=1 Tax=Sesamum alatum TaxID=300844 RepID=A0AAE2CXC6_9LAMI|nr:hypothetical protein Salat_0148300 [Sesamum alatum]
MAARNSSSSYKFQTLVNLLYRYTGISGGSWRGRQFHLRDPPPGCEASADQGLRVKDQSSSDEPPLPAPPRFGFSNWLKWLLGAAVSLLMPFWKNKWDYLLTLGGEAAKVAEEVEVVAEVVEKVATAADKALTGVANQLPDKSKLKEAAKVMEHVSNVAAHDAQFIENIIEKVGDVKQDLEELETLVKPIVDKMVQGKHPKS